MNNTDKCRVRTMTEEDLNCVLQWRNHPKIRRYMLNQHVITAQEHRSWFEQASHDPDRRLLIFEERDSKLGFVNFSGASSGTSLHWGFYTAPDAPAGSGRKLGLTALNFAFNELESHKVCGQALQINTASIRFHKSLGFRQEGLWREQHFIGDTYHNLVCFGLLTHEWLQGNHSE
jgi:UDP-4-amino-4,6-dideoxy-N-acetyl-beta-L-altrosamine N-acetyltransferase